MSIKKLAGQTLWYGLSSFVGRFINYLLTPVLTGIGTAQFGEYTTVYANITFFNIIFTYGMETAYFRFCRDENEKDVFNTASTSLLITTIPLMLIMILMRGSLSEFWSISKHPEYVIYFAFIVGADTLAQIPFAKLRFEQRPQKFAIIKLVNILITVLLTIFFIVICPRIQDQPWISFWYNQSYGIGYAFIANMIASVLTLVLLGKELSSFRFRLDKKLWLRMMTYALPLLIVGFGGMVNETIDRTMLPKLLEGSEEYRNSQNGIYGANYKLAILIVLFIQTFRMGAEPFFIKQSKEEDATKMYARIMNLFVIVCCLSYLFVVCFFDLWKYFMRADKHPEYLTGLVVVPILLLGKIFLGIYYNLSIWYKVTNKTMIGAYITIGGALITLLINLFFIKQYGFVACAWASFACYGFMMVTSYLIGQKYYPIPYQVGRIGLYIGFMLLLFMLNKFASVHIDVAIYRIGLGIVCLIVYTIFAVVMERKEFAKLPVIGKFLK